MGKRTAQTDDGDAWFYVNRTELPKRHARVKPCIQVGSGDYQSGSAIPCHPARATNIFEDLVDGCDLYFEAKTESGIIVPFHSELLADREAIVAIEVDYPEDYGGNVGVS